MTSSTLYCGDCRDIMGMCIADESVQTCVTSPPYFGLRDYGVEGQIGLEPTPDDFVAAMVEVFREVRRVLRDDGTLWLNLGDSYAGSGRGGNSEAITRAGKDASKVRGSQLAAGLHESQRQGGAIGRAWVPPPPGFKNKQLLGVPWRVAFALQDDGWFLRQDIIWSKPNPMPESVTDRCTKAHEYLFLLSKSPRYYFDHEAIKEPVAASTIARLAQNVEAQAGSNRVPGKTNGPMKAVRSKRDSFKRENSKRAEVFPGQFVATHRPGREESAYPLDTRNKRSVWTVATRGFKGAHFATFPSELIEPCILAGSRTDDLVLDPFTGSGTTGMVALQHGRRFVGVELNPEYLEMARGRIGAAS